MGARPAGVRSSGGDFRQAYLSTGKDIYLSIIPYFCQLLKIIEKTEIKLLLNLAMAPYTAASIRLNTIAALFFGGH
ncbi:MAG: hypothetical protein WBD10_16460 [Acidobacteriaceae bacterium]